MSGNLYSIAPTPVDGDPIWDATVGGFSGSIKSTDGTKALLKFTVGEMPSAADVTRVGASTPALWPAMAAVLASPEWTGAASAAGDAKAMAHGAALGLLQWDPEKANPPLRYVAVVGKHGYLESESWWRPDDLDYTGLAPVGKANATPVVRYAYPRWVYGEFATGLKGTTERDRTRIYYAEDGSEALSVADPTPKKYSQGDAYEQDMRRRYNAVNFRAKGIALQVISAVFPGVDPGPKGAELIGYLYEAIQGYLETGEYLVDAITAIDTSVLTDFAWLDTPVAAGVTCRDAMIAEVTEPALGEHPP